MTAFSYRSARSGSLVVGFSIAILVETAAIHALLVRRYPLIAWALTALSVWAILWLVRDYRALGVGRVRVDDETIHFAIGRRYDIHVPRERVDRAFEPTFRDHPTPGTNEGRDYLNLTKPGRPNVLLLLREPLNVRLPGGLRRSVRRIALHLDDPGSFLASLAAKQ